jgi:archaeosine-15-forming tRNA-guanine transglycosylase
MNEYRIIVQEKEHGYVVEGKNVCFEVVISSESGRRRVSSVSGYVNADDDDAVNISRDDALKVAKFIQQLDPGLILNELIRGGWDQSANEGSELGWWQTG